MDERKQLPYVYRDFTFWGLNKSKDSSGCIKLETVNYHTTTNPNIIYCANENGELTYYEKVNNIDELRVKAYISELPKTTSNNEYYKIEAYINYLAKKPLNTENKVMILLQTFNKGTSFYQYFIPFKYVAKEIAHEQKDNKIK